MKYVLTYFVTKKLIVVTKRFDNEALTSPQHLLRHVPGGRWARIVKFVERRETVPERKLVHWLRTANRNTATNCSIRQRPTRCLACADVSDNVPCPDTLH